MSEHDANSMTDDRIPGRTFTGAMEAILTAAPPGYFEVFDIPLVRGRDVVRSERLYEPEAVLRAPSMDAIILDTDLARRLW